MVGIAKYCGLFRGSPGAPSNRRIRYVQFRPFIFFTATDLDTDDTVSVYDWNRPKNIGTGSKKSTFERLSLLA